MSGNLSKDLGRLARQYGVQTSYYDIAGRQQRASNESLLLVLRSLGAPIGGEEDVSAALRERRQAVWNQFAQPVAVAWEGAPLALSIRVRSALASRPIACQLQLESGEIRTWSCNLGCLPTADSSSVEGIRYVSKLLPIPGTLPWGYHTLRLEMPGRAFEVMIISAPLKAYTAEGRLAGKVWGVFLPLYALHSQRSWGCGDFSDLEALMEWTASLGGQLVATLPFLASCLDVPFDPSPYAPASRLFWNEFFLNVTGVPELQSSPAARRLMGSAEVQAELEVLRSTRLVNYRRQMALKRRLLEELARSFFAQASPMAASFRRFRKESPKVEDYARFRATGERQQAPWPQWPERLKEGLLLPGDYEEETKRYHVYVQWLAQEQIRSLSTRARKTGLALYLDLPLGVHPWGYDAWREREIFAPGVSGGSPPDTFFTKGQNWGFAPFHPERMRVSGYRYIIACLRHLLQQADILRIDHIMSLHRLFWIPTGLEARQGVYVRYPAEELYALLTLESHRHRTPILGEDLGTVPRYVRPTMARHNIHRMYVMQYAVRSQPNVPLRAISPLMVASLNTHDMPPFAAFWRGLDIEYLERTGRLDKAGALRERNKRRAAKQALVGLFRGEGLLHGGSTARDLLSASLAHLSASPARIVLVSLEDLWLEERPQNIPGTVVEYPNWQRKARYGLEEFSRTPQVIRALREIDRLRKKGMSRNENLGVT